MSAECLVRVSGVRKIFRTAARDVEALRGVDLRIDEPGFYAIMGASGSGKSTLLHLLAGLDRPDAGEIEVAGRRVDTMTERELTRFRRRGVGIVFQQFNLLPTMTALENVTLPGVLDGQPADELRRRGATLLDELGLADRLEHRPDALSGGEQQRVAIARAMLARPPVLLADEPTGNLDSTTSAALWTLLHQVAARHAITLVVVTHEPAAAAQCRLAFIVRDGVVADTVEVNGMDPAELALRAARPRGTAA